MAAGIPLVLVAVAVSWYFGAAASNVPRAATGPPAGDGARAPARAVEVEVLPVLERSLLEDAPPDIVNFEPAAERRPVVGSPEPGHARLVIRVVDGAGRPVTEGRLVLHWSRGDHTERSHFRHVEQIPIEGEETRIDLPFHAGGAMVFAHSPEHGFGRGRKPGLRGDGTRSYGPEESPEYELVIPCSWSHEAMVTGEITVDGVKRCPEGLEIRLDQSGRWATGSETYYDASTQLAFVDEEASRYYLWPVGPAPTRLTASSLTTHPYCLPLGEDHPPLGAVHDLALTTGKALRLTVLEEGTDEPIVGRDFYLTHNIVGSKTRGRVSLFSANRIVTTDGNGRLELGGLEGDDVVQLKWRLDGAVKLLWSTRIEAQAPPIDEREIRLPLGPNLGTIRGSVAANLARGDAPLRIAMQRAATASDPSLLATLDLPDPAEPWEAQVEPGTWLLWAECGAGDDGAWRRTSERSRVVVERGLASGPLTLDAASPVPFVLTWTDAPSQWVLDVEGRLEDGIRDRAIADRECGEEGSLEFDVRGWQDLTLIALSGTDAGTYRLHMPDPGRVGQVLLDWATLESCTLFLTVNGEPVRGPVYLALWPLCEDVCESGAGRTVRIENGRASLLLPRTPTTWFYGLGMGEGRGPILGLLDTAQIDEEGGALRVDWTGVEWPVSDLWPSEDHILRVTSVAGRDVSCLPACLRSYPAPPRSAAHPEEGSTVLWDAEGVTWVTECNHQ